MGAVGFIGSSGSGGYIPGQQPGGGRTALDAEIASCQRQLADLVTCPSSKTPQGKNAMQALSDRISVARTAINNAPTSPAVDSSAQQARQAPEPGRVDVWA